MLPHGTRTCCPCARTRSLDIFEKEPRLAQVEAIEQALWDGLRGLEQNAKVQDVRVKGAIGVVEFKPGVMDANEIRRMRSECVDHGAWLRPFDNVLYLMPPLSISEKELGVLTKTMHALV